ncbi:MAG: response regulator transcription factor [Clostridia bacterium]|nr:response regulator transcription factor [Clostridia bacterium]NCC44049.1 response regulator transcription factor [Clostridia bacterium]
MRVAICDDDKYLCGSIERLLTGIGKREKIQMEIDAFFDGDTLLEGIEKDGSYDLIYMDIEMERVDGIEAARKIRQDDPYTIFIFVSSYESYCKQLFEVEPFRFLDKPIDEDIFDKYFMLAYKKATDREERFVFQIKKKLYQMPYKEIIYMESKIRVIYVHGKDREYRFYGKLNEVAEELDQEGKCFIRIQHSYLVNYQYIRSMNARSVELENGEILPISLDYKEHATQRYLELIQMG